jgi:predicted DsbA family dithiol-disulfide isomerase
MNENEETDEDDPVFEKPSIIVISDFVCPWCYIGLSEVERLSQEYDLEVQFAPFFLRPDTPPEGMTHTRITPADAPPTPTELRAGPLGIRFTRGRTWLPNTHLALEAAEFAGEYGDQWRFHKEMFKAYFEDLKDIGDIDVLVEVGETAGLPGDALREALTDRRYQERVDEGIAWSRSIGVTAIPTFVFDAKYGMVGAQELPAFRQVLAQLGHEPKATQPA